MSSTNRGSRTEGADNYPTPGWCVRRLLEAVSLPGGVWLEPGAGEGAIIREVQAFRKDVHFASIECRPECQPSLLPISEVVIDDFLKMGLLELLPLQREHRTGALFDVVVMNPPFRLAFPFIKKALEVAHTVVALLRLNFLGSEKRQAFFREMPPDLHVLPNRPSFEKGRTDSIEYAWFVWGPARTRPYGRVRVLAPTPLIERLPTLLVDREQRQLEAAEALVFPPEAEGTL